MSSLAEKLAAMKAKHKAPTPSSTEEQSKDAPATATTATVKTVGTAGASTLGEKKGQFTSLDDLVVSVKETKSELDKHLEKQEAKGAYNLKDEVRELDGLDADLLLSNLQSLDAATVEKTPDIRTFCRAIRKNLEQYSELTHLLTDDQLGIIVGGYLTTAGIETAPKTKAAATKAKKKELTSLNDLGGADLDDLFKMKV